MDTHPPCFCNVFHDLALMKLSAVLLVLDYSEIRQLHEMLLQMAVEMRKVFM